MARATRFFKWYRALPLFLVAVSAALALVMAFSPRALLRRFAYPLTYRDAILSSASRHGVDPLLACAIIKCESGWNASATSSAGAVGLMQVMPDTAATVVDAGLVSSAYSASNLLDPATNIEVGCAYLGYLQNNLASTDQVIAAYNAGIGTLQSWLSELVGSDVSASLADVIAYPETSIYLVRVSDAYLRYQDLYDSELNPR